jgi:ABC-2 type transport system ATP-binding protein
VVVGNQITPIPVKLDGRRHTISRPLEMIAESLPRGHALTLQLVASTVAYAQPRLGGHVRFDAIRLSLPTTG